MLCELVDGEDPVVSLLPNRHVREGPRSLLAFARHLLSPESCLLVYRVRRGSRASRRPSPTKLIDSTARKIIRPGNSACDGASVRKFCASNSSRPQVGTSGGKPSPRNDSVDS